MKPLLITLLLTATATASVHPFEGTSQTPGGQAYSFSGTFTVDGPIKSGHFNYLNLYDNADNVIWGVDDLTLENVSKFTLKDHLITDRDGVERTAHVAWHPAKPLGIRFSVHVATGGLGVTAFTNTFVPYPNGDIDYDGDVDGKDFMYIQRLEVYRPYLTDWQAQYGPILTSAAVQAVPEPSTLWLLVGGLLGLRWRVTEW